MVTYSTILLYFLLRERGREGQGGAERDMEGQRGTERERINRLILCIFPKKEEEGEERGKKGEEGHYPPP
jgi:hypothetical protein